MILENPKDREQHEKKQEEDVENILKWLEKEPDYRPDDPIPEADRAAMKALSDAMEEHKREFLSGPFSVNPEAVTKMRRVLAFFKRLKEDGKGEVKEVHTDPGPGPAYVRFVSDSLVIYGDALDEFADLIESAVFEISPTIDNRVDICFSVHNFWIKTEGTEVQ